MIRKNIHKIAKAALVIFLLSNLYGCAPRIWNPAYGKNVGAERVLSGEKSMKARKFKS
ncbi:MAG: hypothetical protein ACO29O_07040 [Chitinophagaceae bacterium]